MLSKDASGINSIYFQSFTVFQSGDYVTFSAENSMLRRGKWILVRRSELCFQVCCPRLP